MFTIRFVACCGRATVRRLVAACFALSLSLLMVVPAGADEVLPPTDVMAIQKVIRDQIDAFGHDDAGRAFGHASPEVQKRFRTPDNFLRMVKDHYDAVYRAGSVQFVRLRRVQGTWVQTADIVDASGYVWRAAFSMKRQDRNAWKVAGCELTETSAIAA